tara:strand:- start:197 stop:685 length:489 start_codon:yes stop_codon:yes gene_type:complete
MATALSDARKKSIRKKIKSKIKTAGETGYKKGHVAQTKGKLISEVGKKVKKSTGAKKLDTKDKNYTKKKAARKYAKETAQKSAREGAREGARVSHAKKVGKASVAAGKPKGPGLKYTAANKSWRATAMAAAKQKTGAAKKKAMQKVDAGYRKRVGLKKKTYT